MQQHAAGLQGSILVQQQDQQLVPCTLDLHLHCQLMRPQLYSICPHLGDLRLIIASWYTRVSQHLGTQPGSCAILLQSSGLAVQYNTGTAAAGYALMNSCVLDLPCWHANITVHALQTRLQFDYLGETTEGNLHLVQRLQRDGMVQVFGLNSLAGALTMPVKELSAATQSVLDELGVPHRWPAGTPERGVYCSRTLNLRSIKAIGYDMDYTLIHYDVNAWEGLAYSYGLETLRQQGVPVDGLKFDPDLVIRGLIMDKEYGNLIKVDRFGLVKRAMHGTRMMGWQEIRQFYGREVVNLRNEGRWVFLNTLFSVSEGVMYMQLVDRLDQGAFSSNAPGQLTYQGLYRFVSKALYRTHVEGKLKREIIQAPEKYVEVDPEMAQTLLDQKEAGKMLLLITNSDYEYSATMMSYAYDRFLPAGVTWRDLFDMVSK
eukprot:GHRR01024151.1.p1 GENE.GHRR01024151.1~~GHRR01024151.1.p1  ORF type:complete len:430 (+),score=143.52 GHRR01024151.1:536-1825(+)